MCAGSTAPILARETLRSPVASLWHGAATALSLICTSETSAVSSAQEAGLRAPSRDPTQATLCGWSAPGRVPPVDPAPMLSRMETIRSFRCP